MAIRFRPHGPLHHLREYLMAKLRPQPPIGPTWGMEMVAKGQAALLTLGPWQASVLPAGPLRKAEEVRYIRPRLRFTGLTIMLRRSPVDGAWVLRWPDMDTWVCSQDLDAQAAMDHVDRLLRAQGWTLPAGVPAAQ